MDDAQPDVFECMLAQIEEAAGDQENPGRQRWEPLWKIIAKNIRDSTGRDNLYKKLSGAREFLESLDSALHNELGPFAKEYVYRGQLWKHRDINDLYASTKASAREYFVHLDGLRDAARTYIESPWLHNPYLDWVFLDAITAGGLVGTIEGYRNAKQGLAYAMCDGVNWKILLWRLTLTPLGFLISWFAPIALAVYFASAGPWVFWLVAFYYAVSLVLFGRWLWFKFSYLIRRKPSLTKIMMKTIGDVARAYQSLAGPVLHLPSVRKAFEKAAEDGVTFDQITFYILDHLAKKNPSVWDTKLRDSYA